MKQKEAQAGVFDKVKGFFSQSKPASKTAPKTESKPASKGKKQELPYGKVFIASAVILLIGAVVAGVLLSNREKEEDANNSAGGGGGGDLEPDPDVTLPPGSIIKNKTCYSAPNETQLAEGCKDLPVKGFPFQYIRRSCAGVNDEDDFTSETCSFSECDRASGGLRTNTDEIRCDDVPAPQRVTCDGSFTDECTCTTGCADGWQDGSTSRRLCLKDDATVNFGAAKGVNEQDCPFLYCYQWSNMDQDWAGLSRQDCSKICIPELYLNYETLVDNTTVEDQLDVLGGFRYGCNITPDETSDPPSDPPS